MPKGDACASTRFSENSDIHFYRNVFFNKHFHQSEYSSLNYFLIKLQLISEIDSYKIILRQINEADVWVSNVKILRHSRAPTIVP